MNNPLTFEQITKNQNTLGDSFYVLNLDSFRANYVKLNESFKKNYKNFRIGYSYKTNYLPRLCKEADNLGAYAEVVSGMELEIAKRIGVKSNNVICNGPIIDEDVTMFFIERGAKFNIDNLEQLRLIEKILIKNPDKVARIGIRLNLDLEDNDFSRFGLDPNSIEYKNTLLAIENNERIRLIGLHFHATRGDKSTTSYLTRLKKIKIIYDKLIDKHSINYIDLGGGFFGPMDEKMRSQFMGTYFDFNDYADAIGTEMKRMFPDESVELIIEPGLALTVNVLDFYTEVHSIKSIQDKVIINVGGSFYNVKPSAHKKNLTTKVCSGSKIKNQVENAWITGFTCLENDILHNCYSGEMPSIGDYILFQNVGAYTFVFKPPFIKLSPAIVHFEYGELIIDKKKENFESTFESYTFL
jgi:diaminopimelate decarboxylase